MRAVLAAIALLLTACVGGSAPGTAGPSPAPAFLDPCPTTQASTTATRSGGLQDIELSCLGSGPKVRLSALRGPLLVNVWASWCGPCQEEVPELEAFYRKARGKVGVLGIDFQDTNGSAQDFAGHIGMTYPSVVDHDGETHYKSFRAAGPPETIFVAADGTVAFRHVGAFTSAAQIEQLVREHLGVTL